MSLISYTITSADKALKYVNLTANFEAEFAFKLYTSDRENLMNELNTMNVQDIGNSRSVTGYNMSENMPVKPIQSTNSLALGSDNYTLRG